MQITFSPTIGDSFSILSSAGRVPSHIRFTARLRPDDHQFLVSQGTAVQLWSDIPAPNEGFGSWHAFEFQPDHLCDTLDCTVQSTSQDGLSTRQPEALLSLCVPILAAGPQSVFSYTFRLVSADGSVKWLGEYGRNGTITIQPAHKLDFPENCVEKDGDHVCTGGGTVATVHRMDDYTLWAFGEGDSFGASPNPSVLFCVPSRRIERGVCPHTYIFAASRGSFSVSPTGDIIPSIPTTVHLCVSSPHTRLMESAVKYASSISRVIDCQPSTGCLALASLAESFPVDIITLPLYPTSSLARSRFNADGIRAALQGETTFAVFAPDASECHFVQLPTNSEYVELPFAVPPSGTRFLVSPSHTLVSQSGRVEIAILANHELVRRSIDPVTLPTPPPSPRIHTTTKFDRDGRPPLQGTDIIPHRTEGGDSNKASAVVLRGLPRNGMLVILFKMLSTVLCVFLELARVFWAPRSNSKDSSATTLPSRPDEAPTSLANSDIDGDSSPALHPSDADDKLIADDNVPQSASSLSVEVKQGSSKIILRGLEPVESSCPIEIEMGGRSLETTVRAINDSMSIIEFQTEQNGWIKVSYVR